MVPTAMRCKSFLVCMQEVIREQNHGDELDEHASEVGGILMYSMSLLFLVMRCLDPEDACGLCAPD